MSETGEVDGGGLKSVSRALLVVGTSSLISGRAATRGAGPRTTLELGAGAGAGVAGAWRVLARGPGAGAGMAEMAEMAF